MIVWFRHLGIYTCWSGACGYCRHIHLCWAVNTDIIGNPHSTMSMNISSFQLFCSDQPLRGVNRIPFSACNHNGEAGPIHTPPEAVVVGFTPHRLIDCFFDKIDDTSGTSSRRDHFSLRSANSFGILYERQKHHASRWRNLHVVIAAAFASSGPLHFVACWAL